MSKKKKIIIIAVIIIVVLGILFLVFRKPSNNQIDLDSSSNELINTGPVSPISGLSCDNWNRRPIAVMQPGDVEARPAAGFSQADMVIEMPVITASVTRLMAIYVCNTPEEVGSMRSARHDFIHLAKGLDAIFVPWGRSETHGEDDPVGLAQGILDRNEIDNINCNQDAGTSATVCSENPCFRKEGMSRGVDTGYGHPALFWSCSQELGYRMENNFSGYPHQAEVAVENRPENGRLRVAYAGKYEVEYDYDKESNSYLRIWGDSPDIDRNTGERIAPKNIVVMIAKSEQIEGQYNNVQLGDPWYDESDSGPAQYYFNGQEYMGTWKKDKASIDSKLTFYDENGEEVMFVPGQIWVEVLEPGQGLSWKTEQY